MDNHSKPIVMSWLSGLADEDWREFYSDSEVSQTAKWAMELIEDQEKEIERIKRLSDEMAKVALHK